MIDYDFFKECDSCSYDRVKERDSYFLNPVKDAEKVKKASWLDDYGWI